MRTKPQQKKIQEKKERAYQLHLEGLTTREIGALVGRSHTWVANAIIELSTVLDK